MTKLISGILLSLITIALTIASIYSYYHHNDQRASILIAVVSGIGVIVSIIGLIVPGANEINNSKVQIENAEQVKIQNSEIHLHTDNLTIDDLPILNTSDEDTAAPVGIKIQVSIKERKKAGDTWASAVFANVGDEVEFQVYFRNDGDPAENVSMLITLPTDLELVPGSVILYNSTTTADGKEGLNLSGDIVTSHAVSIGGYGRYGEAYVRFKAKVTDENLYDRNILRTWVFVQAEDVQSRDESNVIVAK